jgi:hypothetical protein
MTAPSPFIPPARASADSAARLCASFYELAEWVYARIHAGYSVNISIGEESFTDFGLLRIAEDNPSCVETIKFNRVQEGQQTGADWVWLIGARGGLWLPLLVQAKMLHRQPDRTDAGRSLRYRNGSQHALLLAYARQHRLLPVYCIYNHVTTDFRPTHCRREQYACAILPTRNRDTLLRRWQRVHHRHVLAASIPLSSLVCWANPNTDWAASAAALLRHVREWNLGGDSDPEEVAREDGPLTLQQNDEDRDGYDPDPESVLLSETAADSLHAQIVRSQKGRGRWRTTPRLAGVMRIYANGVSGQGDARVDPETSARDTPIIFNAK